MAPDAPRPFNLGGATAAAPNAPSERQNTYGQILKSSALIGGASAVNIVVSIIRAKAMALLVGPAGVGLVGLYGSILDLAQSVAGMGINSSGVRQIAEAVGTGDASRVSMTAAVLRRTSAVLGFLGAALVAVFCRQISLWTFGTEEFAAPVVLLSVAVLFKSVSDGQNALIQGTRRIADLARVGVLAALLGTVVSLALVFFLREDGVVPSLVSAGGITLLVSWWYRRKIEIPTTALSTRQLRHETGALLKLGCAFMASTVLTTAAAYAIRTLVRNGIGLEAAGLYQSAWNLGGLYVGFILQAMGSDFYPRLTGVASDHDECNRLVNEQTQVGLLLAGPGVVGTLTFAPLVIGLFYSRTFAGAVEPLRWICLGMALRVVAWPMGYIVLAKNARAIFFLTEVAATVVHVGLAYLLLARFGLPGATMAFFGLYVWHGLLIYAIARRLTGFSWSRSNRRTALFFLPLMAAVFCGFQFLPAGVATAVGILATTLSAVYSARTICCLVPHHRLPPVLRRSLIWLRLSAPMSTPA